MFLFYRHQLGSVPYLLMVAPLLFCSDDNDVLQVGPIFNVFCLWAMFNSLC